MTTQTAKPTSANWIYRPNHQQLLSNPVVQQTNIEQQIAKTSPLTNGAQRRHLSLRDHAVHAKLWDYMTTFLFPVAPPIHIEMMVNASRVSPTNKDYP